MILVAKHLTFSVAKWHAHSHSSFKKTELRMFRILQNGCHLFLRKLHNVYLPEYYAISFIKIFEVYICGFQLKLNMTLLYNISTFINCQLLRNCWYHVMKCLEQIKKIKMLKNTGLKCSTIITLQDNLKFGMNSFLQ